MAQVIDLGLFDRAMSRVRRVFTRVPARRDAAAGPLAEAMEAALSNRGGEHAARLRAADLARDYRGFDDEGRTRFLDLLAARFGRDNEAVDAAIAAARAATGAEREVALAALGAALEPSRLILLRRFAAMPGGLGFLIRLREDARRLGPRNPAFAPLDDDLRQLLALWFDPAMLELVRVDWASPAAFLEKLIAYEAVHAMDGWSDLKRRLADDRRIFALRHPMLPEEPLIFVEVALRRGMPGRIADLIGSDLPVEPADKADTAVFYSISNCQAGLAGVPLGNSLIKQVAARLAGEFRQIETFVTLSPAPGFAAWLKRVAADAAEAERVRGAIGVDPSPLAQAVADGSANPEQLARVAAHYLARERNRNGRALDPVAHFHLGNGARLERVLAGADLSARGLAQGAGVMVNYLYDRPTIEENVDSYAGDGKVALGSQVRRLLKGAAATDLALRASA